MGIVDLRQLTKKNKITKSNTLIEAKYKLTLNEQRLIFLLISMIEPEDKEFQPYKIKIQDFITFFSLKSQTTSYDEIKETTAKLLNNTLTIRGKTFLQINWLSSAEYFENEGIVELCFDPKLKPYLLQLKEHFTSYRLENILALKSTYAIRLYELLLKEYNYYHRQKNIFVFNLKKLREMLGIGVKEYVKFNHFKTRVLEPAKKELKEKSDIYFDYTCLKTGRKITDIEFTLHINNAIDPRQITLDQSLNNESEKTENPLPEQQEKLFQELLRLGIKPEKKARELVLKFPEQEILWAIEGTEKDLKADKIKTNQGGYLRKAIEQGFYKKTDNEIKEEQEKIVKLELGAKLDGLISFLDNIKDSFNAFYSVSVDDYLKGVSEQEKESLINDFENEFISQETTSKSVKMRFYQEGVDCMMVRSHFKKFIGDNILKIKSDDFLKKEKIDLDILYNDLEDVKNQLEEYQALSSTQLLFYEQALRMRALFD